jgi:hypothetical protein
MYVVIKVWKYLTFQRYKFITLIALYTQEILQKKNTRVFFYTEELANEE